MACVWLTIDEAAHHLGVHKDTIRRFMRLKTLKAYRPMGKRSAIIRICKNDLDTMGTDWDGPNE